MHHYMEMTKHIKTCCVYPGICQSVLISVLLCEYVAFEEVSQPVKVQPVPFNTALCIKLAFKS